MSDFENQLLKLVNDISEKFNGVLVLFGLLFVIGCVALLILSFCYDKKEADKRDQKIKEYVDEVVENAKK